MASENSEAEVGTIKLAKTPKIAVIGFPNDDVIENFDFQQLACAYEIASNFDVSTRTWQNALDAIIDTKTGPTKNRWQRAAREKALDLIRSQVIVESKAENILACLKAGTVSTNVHLRKLHNFCISMNWLPWPLVPKRLWLEVKFQPKRAITIAQHPLILEREKNPERRSFYELCWHLGGSQSDIAHLKAEDIDWPNQTIAYARQKTGSLAMIHFGPDIEAILRQMPATGPLFPYLQTIRSGDCATEFKQRCDGLGIKGVSLHSYRYAWAERAKQCGYPERFAQEALGHNSKAIHRGPPVILEIAVKEESQKSSAKDVKEQTGRLTAVHFQFKSGLAQMRLME